MLSLSLSLSLLVAIGEVAAWFALIVQLSLSLLALSGRHLIGEDRRMKKGEGSEKRKVKIIQSVMTC
jgi:hypothetical protein